MIDIRVFVINQLIQIGMDTDRLPSMNEIFTLCDMYGYGEADTQSAVINMLASGHLELTPNRRIKIGSSMPRGA